MAKPRQPAADFAVYLVIRCAVCVLQALTLETGRSLAELLAWLAYHVDRRHRDVALDNLRQAFPDQHSEAELRRRVLDVYRHFAGIVLEMVHLPRKLHACSWRRYISLPEGREVVNALLSDRPVLIVTGHYGNWEMAGYALAMFGFKSSAIARPLDNPYLDDFIRRFRGKTGQKLLAKKGEFELIEEVLKEKGILCTLGDQDAGQRGLFVEFFGRPASTHKAIALLALEHRAHLLVATARKIAEPMRYAIEIGDALAPEQAESLSVRTLTQRLTTALEGLVRRDPWQYFWLHRRWKHQPLKRQRQAA
jgi:KDO2-lipid IV(A) lauroyltransferase